MTFPTNPIYKLLKNPITNVVDSVKKMDGNILNVIPFHEANSDYQEYLEWVSKGNTAEEAD